MLSWLRRLFGIRPKLPLSVIAQNDAMERNGVLYVRLPPGLRPTEERRRMMEHQAAAVYPQYTRVEFLEPL